jgi:hypothetical protein
MRLKESERKRRRRFDAIFAAYSSDIVAHTAAVGAVVNRDETLARRGDCPNRHAHANILVKLRPLLQRCGGAYSDSVQPSAAGDPPF